MYKNTATYQIDNDRFLYLEFFKELALESAPKNLSYGIYTLMICCLSFSSLTLHLYSFPSFYHFPLLFSHDSHSSFSPFCLASLSSLLLSFLLFPKVKVQCESSEGSWRFPCDQWLCLDRGDGHIERELHLSLPPSMNFNFNSKWEVHVFTSDLRGAGTDARVTLQVHGSKGSSPPTLLRRNIFNFEQGEHDIFCGIEVPGWLGVLEAVTVSHDGSGPYPDWHLEKVELKNSLTGEDYQCQCDRFVKLFKCPSERTFFLFKCKKKLW